MNSTANNCLPPDDTKDGSTHFLKNERTGSVVPFRWAWGLWSGTEGKSALSSKWMSDKGWRYLNPAPHCHFLRGRSHE